MSFYTLKYVFTPEEDYGFLLRAIIGPILRVLHLKCVTEVLWCYIECGRCCWCPPPKLWGYDIDVIKY